MDPGETLNNVDSCKVAIKVAIENNRTDLVKYILDWLDHNDVGSSSNKLLSEVIDVDTGTALHLATKRGSVDIVRALLSCGSDPSQENDGGLNPYQLSGSEPMRDVYEKELLMSVANNRYTSVKQLIMAGVSPNSIDHKKTKNSLLHWAVSHANVNMLELLCELGCGVGSVNGDGLTALDEAVLRSKYDMVEVLLGAGADPARIITTGKHAGGTVLNLCKNNTIKDLLTLHIKDKQEDGSQTPSESSSPCTLANDDTLALINGDLEKSLTSTSPLPPSLPSSPQELRQQQEEQHQHESHMNMMLSQVEALDVGDEQLADRLHLLPQPLSCHYHHHYHRHHHDTQLNHTEHHHHTPGNSGTIKLAEPLAYQAKYIVPVYVINAMKTSDTRDGEVDDLLARVERAYLWPVCKVQLRCHHVKSEAEICRDPELRPPVNPYINTYLVVYYLEDYLRSEAYDLHVLRGGKVLVHVGSDQGLLHALLTTMQLLVQRNFNPTDTSTDQADIIITDQPRFSCRPINLNPLCKLPNLSKVEVEELLRLFCMLKYNQVTVRNCYIMNDAFVIPEPFQEPSVIKLASSYQIDVVPCFEFYEDGLTCEEHLRSMFKLIYTTYTWQLSKHIRSIEFSVTLVESILSVAGVERLYSILSTFLPSSRFHRITLDMNLDLLRHHLHSWPSVPPNVVWNIILTLDDLGSAATVCELRRMLHMLAARGQRYSLLVNPRASNRVALVVSHAEMVALLRRLRVLFAEVVDKVKVGVCEGLSFSHLNTPYLSMMWGYWLLTADVMWGHTHLMDKLPVLPESPPGGGGDGDDCIRLLSHLTSYYITTYLCPCPEGGTARRLTDQLTALAQWDPYLLTSTSPLASDTNTLDHAMGLTTLLLHPDTTNIEAWNLEQCVHVQKQTKLVLDTLHQLHTSQDTSKDPLAAGVMVRVREVEVVSELLHLSSRIARHLLTAGRNRQQNGPGVSVINVGLSNLPSTVRTDLANRLLQILSRFGDVLGGSAVTDSKDMASTLRSASICSDTPRDTNLSISHFNDKLKHLLNSLLSSATLRVSLPAGTIDV